MTGEQRKYLKRFISDSEWQAIFEELLRRDLIDVLNVSGWRGKRPAMSLNEFYDEEIMFNNSD